MMKKSISVPVLIIFIFYSTFSFSQSYTNAIGVRGGLGYGLTAKHFLSQSFALEGIAAFRWRGLTLTALGEYHGDIPDVDGLKWFAGAGAHIGYWSSRYYYDSYYNGWNGNTYGADAVFGLDIIGGLDYDIRTITDLPLNISFDWRPMINISRGWTSFWPFGGGFSVRYILN